MREKPYNRGAAVAYAHEWAFRRNPRYYDFENLGGDCTNFASQVIFSGAGVMNTTPTFGWYYHSLNSRSPSWTGVEFLHRFLINNRSVGPVAVEVGVEQAEIGDLAQLSFNGSTFQHSPVIVSAGERPSPENILIAAHSFDADNRPLNTYVYERVRFLHITHVNIW